MKQNKSIKTSYKLKHANGAIAVEYAFAALLAAVLISAGIPVLFDASKDLLGLFVGWLQPHYP